LTFKLHELFVQFLRHETVTKFQMIFLLKESNTKVKLLKLILIILRIKPGILKGGILVSKDFQECTLRDFFSVKDLLMNIKLNLS